MNGKQFAIDKKSIEQYERYNKHMSKIANEKIRNHDQGWEHKEWSEQKAKLKPKWTEADQRIEDELWES